MAMLLFTKKQIKQAKPKIEILLESFASSEKPEEWFFTDAMSYILKSRIVYCPEINGEIIGIGYVFNIFGIFPNLGMVVKKEWQGRGIGQNIMEVILFFIRCDGGHLWSCLWDSNNKIIQLHLKNGFKKYSKARDIGWYGVSYGVSGWINSLVTKILLPCYEFLRKRISNR